MGNNREIIQVFLTEHNARFSNETTRSYKISLNQFFSFCNKSYDVIKARDIRTWLSSLEATGLKPKSIHTKLAALKTFYNYCMEESFVKKDPTMNIHSPKRDDSLPYYLTKRQMVLLQEETQVKLRDRAIVEALYATGVRISELLNVHLEDIKWDSRQIWIRKGKGNKERFVVFTHDCAERLKTYLDARKDQSQYLISNGRGGSLSYAAVDRLFQGLSKELGFKVSPHTLRHTFAAHLAEKGMPQSFIQELLGHDNINSTRIYTRLMQQERKKLYDRYQ